MIVSQVRFEVGPDWRNLLRNQVGTAVGLGGDIAAWTAFVGVHLQCLVRSETGMAFRDVMSSRSPICPGASKSKAAHLARHARHLFYCGHNIREARCPKGGRARYACGASISDTFP